MTQQAQEPAEARDRASAAPAGSVRVLAVVGAVLALVFYLLGFVSDVGTTALVGAFVIGGGLLAGTAALPRAGRVLAPAAVVVTVGMLSLLQVVASSRGGALLIGALVVAFLQAVVVVAALLIDAGVVGASEKRPRQQVDHTPAPSPEWSPDQAWLGQPDPPQRASVQPAGARGATPSDLTMTYGPLAGGGGQPQYAATPDTTAIMSAPGSAPVSGAFPVGQSGAVPVFGQSAAAAQGPATEVVPVYGLSGAGAAERGPSAAGPSQPALTDAPVPLYGMSGGDVVNNGASAAERGQSGSAHGVPADAQAPLFGVPADAQAPLFGVAAPAGAAGEHGQSGQVHGGPVNAPVPLYGLSTPGSPGTLNGRATASGPSHSTPGDAAASPFGPPAASGPGGVSERGQPGQTHGAAPADAPAPLYGLSGARGPGAVNGRATASGASHAAPGEGSVPQFAPPGVGPAAAGQRGQSGSVPGSPPQFGPSASGASGTSYAGPTGTGPAHAAPTGSTPVVPAYGSPSTGSTGAQGSSGSRHAGPGAVGDAGAAARGSSGSGSASVQRQAPSSSGAHHAPTGEVPVFPKAGTNGAGSPTSGAYRGGQAAAGETAPPTYGRGGAGGRGSSNGVAAPSGSGSHYAPTPVNRGDSAVPPRAGSAPVGREMSGEAPIPMYGLSGGPGSANPVSRPSSPDQGRGKPDTSSDTTAFRAQPAGTASDATPAFGHNAFDGGDATMVAQPGWLGAANGSAANGSSANGSAAHGSAEQPGTSSKPESPRRGRHGSPRKGRHGQPDEAPDSTRVFPNPER